jgi:hypothetical protein
VGGCCEHGNELPGSIKGGVFLDQLSDIHLLKRDSVPTGAVGVPNHRNRQHGAVREQGCRVPA